MPKNYSSLHINSKTEGVSTLWLGTLLPLCIFIIVGNSIALAIFLRKNFRAKKSNYLLVNVIVADLMVGMLYLVLAIEMCASFINIHTTLNFMKEYEILFTVTITSVLLASICSLSVMSVERVIAVFWPFHHRLAKRCHYFTAIALVWILSAIAFLEYVSQPNPQTTKGQVRFFLSYYLIVVISLLTIFISYFSIWIKMKFFNKFRNCRTIQENSKLTKTLFIVTVVSLGTWSPNTIVEYMIATNTVPYQLRYSGYYLISMVLLVSNSFLNLVVYSFRIPEFRRELRKVFCNCR